MTKLRLLGLLLLPVLLLGCANKRVNEENYYKINDKMTLKEVQSLLGSPEQDKDELEKVRFRNEIKNKNIDTYFWQNDKKTIVVCFDKNGKMVFRAMEK